MPEALFSRVIDDTNWYRLYENMQLQKKQRCKPLHYKTLAEISLSKTEFNILVNELANPHLCYLPYSPHSIADDDGIWKCILVDNKIDNRKIALYTAGRTFPLYAAIII